MFGLTRLAMWITAAVMSAILLGITVGIAQSPSSPTPSPAPDLPQLPFPEQALPHPPTFAPPEPSVLRQISDVLQRKTPLTETGDTEVDDLGEILSGFDSILVGSSLDPFSDKESEASSADAAQRAFAAELLLKTSRMLQQTGPVDQTRRQLVNQMRGEAVRLLSQ